ncbi:hypothetical protein OG589_33825 [Sphaerisporangium sp. NBC_01403]|uniref:hypothetical protein n=1 Tax=Sphaerisporangium sp. NBC_01403 TaxID=2903599 RepID=UPI003256469E
MAYPDHEHRPRLITGLRALADFLESRPAVTAPRDVAATVFVPRGTDADMRAEVERLAGLIGSTIDPEGIAYGHHRTAVRFGPVEYGAVAILAGARARYEALMSYSGAVVPDLHEGA